MPSITRGPTRSSTRRTETRQRILDATERLLAAGASFTELGVLHIVGEAGVARSSFYAHFDDKTDLLLALTPRLSAVAHDAHAAWDPADDDAFSAMLDGFTAIVRHYRDHAEVLAAVLEVAGYDARMAARWDAEVAVFRRRTEGWLEGERAEGRTSVALRPGAAARIVVDGGMRAITDQVIRGDAADDASFAAELTAMWWYGAFRRPGPAA
jgi:AcrR family transcriptional regulator